MKKNIKWIILFVLLFALLLTYAIDTYAKYVTKASGNANISVARWNINVNNTSIQEGNTISDIITPIFPGNKYIAEGVIAPNAEGYFDLDLNFEEVDVSFEYEISVSTNENSVVPDLIVTGYSIDDGDITEISDEVLITDKIYLENKPTDRKIRVYIKWIDDENSTMDNAQDTLATADNSNTALLDVDLTFRQIAEKNEEIITK